MLRAFSTPRTPLPLPALYSSPTSSLLHWRTLNSRAPCRSNHKPADYPDRRRQYSLLYAPWSFHYKTLSAHHCPWGARSDALFHRFQVREPVHGKDLHPLVSFALSFEFPTLFLEFLSD